jgi:hypothetical protein
MAKFGASGGAKGIKGGKKGAPSKGFINTPATMAATKGLKK